MPDAEAFLAADCLVNSAIGLTQRPTAPGRARRLVILSEFAQEICPDHEQASRILADVYLAQGDSTSAAAMLKKSLYARPGDYSLWMEWLAASLASGQTAEARLDFLDSVIRDQALPESVRAEALVRYANVLLGRGDRDRCEQLFTAALRLEPYHYQALQGWVGLQESISVVDSANLMFRMLRGSPLNANIAHDLGVLIGSVGLWKEAITFFDYAWAIATRDVGTQEIPADWAADYANAMMDAGQLQRTIDTFTPLLAQYPASVDLLSLLVEANLGLGNIDKARTLIDKIENTYRSGSGQGGLHSHDIEMAMFYLTTRPDSRLAMAHARGAIEGADPKDRESVILQRLLGAAELEAGSEEQGLQRLTRIQDTDPYAAVFLAAHYLKKNQLELSRQAVLAGAKLGRSGPAFRRLDTMARRNAVEIPPMAGSAQISRMSLAFNELYLQMGLHPERFVEASIVAPADPFVVGEPITVTLLLHNKGPLPLPVGAGGLFEPVAAIQVELTGPWEEPVVVTDLPLADWPAPHHLAPDQTVSCQLRIDVGPLGDMLAASPLSEITMAISGILDPLEREGGLSSSLPDVGIAPVTATRASLIPNPGDADALTQACDDTMAAIAAAMQDADAATRLRAARQVGCLKVLLARVDEGKATVPEHLPRETMRGQLADHITQLLGDGSPLVRAEMINALKLASIGDRALILQAVLDDPSPLVRLRTAELLGTMDDQASRDMLFKLTQDPDQMVAETAEVFMSGWTYGVGIDRSDSAPAPTTVTPMPRIPLQLPDDQDDLEE